MLDGQFYQIDEVSALLGLIRRAATSYLHGEVIELLNEELDHLCPDIWQQELDLAPMV